jgi:hypothetical protein
MNATQLPEMWYLHTKSYVLIGYQGHSLSHGLQLLGTPRGRFCTVHWQIAEHILRATIERTSPKRDRMFHDSSTFDISAQNQMTQKGSDLSTEVCLYYSHESIHIIHHTSGGKRGKREQQKG